MKSMTFYALLSENDSWFTPEMFTFEKQPTPQELADISNTLMRLVLMAGRRNVLDLLCLMKSNPFSE